MKTKISTIPLQPIITILLIVLVVILGYIVYKKSIENNTNTAIENFQSSSPTPIPISITIPKVEFPFKNIYDDNGELINVILLAAPFREKKHEDLYETYKQQGFSFCGISSYLEFPGVINNPYEDQYHKQQNHDYIGMASAWLHCFRNPEQYLSKQHGVPNILLTEADLKNTDTYKPNPSIQKEYDFIYVCLKDNDKCDAGWQSYNRNWDLAKKCLIIMCQKYKLKGIIIGRENCPITEFCSGIVKLLPFLPFNEFQAEMQKCRFLFVPNVSDASPRVITEALCYNMPVLVNYNIVGGWHNVIPGITGEFFNDENDISISIEKITTNYISYEPRDWFVKNRGKRNSGSILAKFLILHFTNINNPNMVYATITI
jgi:hypothetical protein